MTYLVDSEQGSTCHTSRQFWQATARSDAHRGFHCSAATFFCRRCFRVGVMALNREQRTENRERCDQKHHRETKRQHFTLTDMNTCLHLSAAELCQVLAVVPFGVVDLDGVVQQGDSKLIGVRMPGEGSHHAVRPGNTEQCFNKQTLLSFY